MKLDASPQVSLKLQSWGAGELGSWGVSWGCVQSFTGDGVLLGSIAWLLAGSNSLQVVGLRSQLFTQSLGL